MNDKPIIIPEKIQELINNTEGVHNIYHIQTIDENDNVVDEKFGLNLTTNGGIQVLFRDRGFSWNDWSLFVGTGSTTPTEADTSIETPVLGSPTRVGWYYGNDAGDEWIPSYVEPMQYDSSTHIMSIRCKMGDFYWPYNVSGVTDTVTLTEVGIGSSSSSLMTRSLIYDSSGNISSIDKHINERLYITIYWTFVMNSNLMELLWSKGIYGFISPLIAFPQIASSNYSYGRYMCVTSFYREDGQYACWYDASGTDWGTFGGPQWSWRVNGYFNALDTTTHLMSPPSNLTGNKTYDEYPGTQYLSGLAFGQDKNAAWVSYDANGRYGNRMVLYSFTEHPAVNAEALTITDLVVNGASYPIADKNNLFINDIFGKKNTRTGRGNYSGWKSTSGALPATNFEITALSMYNHLSGDWDIDEMSQTVTGTHAMKYEEVMWRRCGKLFVTFNGTDQYVYIYANPLNQYTITAFNNPNVTIYATDEYWDVSTYQLVNNSSVSASLAHCKYYIVTGGWSGTKLNPVFADDYDTSASTGYKRHRLIPTNPIVDLSTDMGDFDTIKTNRGDGVGSARPCYSDTNKWFATADAVVYTPDIYDSSSWVMWDIAPKNRTNDVRVYGFYGHRFSTSDRMICVETCGAGSYEANRVYGDSIRIFDLSSIDQLPSTDPIPYTDITLPTNNGNVDILVSFSDLGNGEAYALVQFPNTSIAYIIDVYNESYAAITDSVQYAYVIAGTKYCAYYNMDQSDPSQVTILDMSTNTVVKTYNVGRDSALTYTINGIVGWNNMVYVSFTSSASISYISCIDITTDTETLIEEVNYPAFRPGNDYGRYRYGGIAYNSEVCVFTSGSYDMTYFVTSDDPGNIRPLIPYDTSKSTQYMTHYLCYPTLKYMNNSKQLILVGNGRPYTVASGQSRDIDSLRVRIFDMGLIIDQGVDYVPISHMGYTYYMPTPSNTENWVSSGCQFPYGDGVIYQRCTSDAESANRRLYWFPIQQFIQHKMTGTTTTINNYNNPFRLDLTPFLMTVTNSMDVINNISPT